MMTILILDEQITYSAFNLTCCQ